jgi:predicted ATPase/DNA-binding winged helix-turn-helix (wHTH) protein
LPSRFADKNEQVLQFGPYLLFRSQKVLRDGDRTLRLGGRALDLLIALVDKAGEIVSRKELLDYAWPNTMVEENNLRVHIATLRKMLGNGSDGGSYIVNVAGRGYKFVAPVMRVDAPTPHTELESEERANLPPPLTRIFGRDGVITRLIKQVPGSRLVTIVGTAGVGKTTVAVSVAKQLVEFYQRVCFVELSVVEDPGLVPSMVATVLGISVLTDDPVASLRSHLRDVSMLIVLDNCEHVIGCAAELVEDILRAAPGVDVLATSREPLSAEGEHVCYLAPLRSPPDSLSLIAETALSFAAVQLFVERAASGLESFSLTESNVNDVAAICRRLDGLPFAIELVAAQINLFGIRAISRGFDDDLLLTTRGRRTARSRHQSLRATLSWSYKTLASPEQIVLRRISVFKGPFSFEAAAAIASDGALTPALVRNALASLVAKCLCSTDLGGNSVRYRLLNTTRAFASEQLRKNNERSEMSLRHAKHFCQALEGSLDSWEKMTRKEWLTQYGSVIDDVRAALEWAFSPGGDVDLGAALTVASLPFGVQLSLIDEFKKRAALALDALGRTSSSKPVWELRINNALVGLIYNTGGPSEALTRAVNRSLVLAQQTGVARYSIEPFTHRATIYAAAMGNYAAALDAASALEELARQLGDPMAMLLADRVGAQVHHFAGNQRKARALCERVLRHPTEGAIPLVYGQLPLDRQISMRIMLARVLWLEGSADQAQELAAYTIKLAASDGALTMAQALALAGCPVAFWRGDLQSATNLTKSLLDHSRRYNFEHWTNVALCYEQSLEGWRQSIGNNQREQRIIDASPAGAFDREALCTVFHLWLDPPTIERGRSGLCGWTTPEILRLTGNMQLRGNSSGDEGAELVYRSSLRIARDQQASAWELRSATSLAHLLTRQDRRNEALDLLGSVYSQFKEGFETADLKSARSLIGHLTSD